MSDFLTIEANLRCAMRFFGLATGSGDIQPLPGGVAIYSGLDYGVFNIALLDGPVDTGAQGLEERLSEIAKYFSSRSSRWSFWLCEDLLKPHDRRRARQVLQDFNLRPISHPPGMIATGLRPPEHDLPEIEWRPVANEALRRSFTEITSVCFEIPYTIAQAVYTPERAWQGDYQGFVGFAGSHAVSIVAIVVDAGALGVYSLATLPGYRRQGYGEALLRSVVRDFQERTGIQQVVLQSTEAGYAMYRRMGFRDATRFSVYLTR